MPVPVSTSDVREVEAEVADMTNLLDRFAAVVARRPATALTALFVVRATHHQWRGQRKESELFRRSDEVHVAVSTSSIPTNASTTPPP
jgi:hypothetical protein